MNSDDGIAREDQLVANPTEFRVRISGWRTDNGDFRGSYVGAKVIGLGVEVEVEGYLQDGILIAREIEDEDDLFDDDDDVEISGDIYDFDGTARSFRINGVLVRYNNGTDFDDIRLASLANQRSAEGGYLEAFIIEREDDDDIDD
ncbi:DUF5666 domain-containing protein [Marinobacter halophilus]|uniref:DUF5666 domain-containing protein n=1 Tax=Marinobacter halophilus TaxID=1323740 RepID=UPI0016665E4C|nr:DUF5666 domain-containing protein [Marinobacter halophilus]GGC59924.1 hypothetical protein GCM10011362_05420 [Marinobacter halophilus]